MAVPQTQHSQGHLIQENVLRGKPPVTGGTGGIPTHFTPSPLREASDALLKLIALLAKMSVIFITQLSKEIAVAVTTAVALKKVAEAIGDKLFDQSIAEGCTLLATGVLTITAAGIAWKSGLGDVKKSQEDYNGAKNYQKAFEETSPPELVISENPQSAEGNPEGAGQRMSERDIQKGIETLKNRDNFVGEDSKAVEVSKEDKQLIKLLKRDNNGEFEKLKNEYNEKVKSKKESLERLQGIVGNKLNTYTIVTNAVGSAANGAMQAGTAILKKEQSDLQGQETTGKTSLDLSQSIMNQLNAEAGKDMNAIDPLVQEMIGISNANQLA